MVFKALESPACLTLLGLVVGMEERGSPVGDEMDFDILLLVFGAGRAVGRVTAWPVMPCGGQMIPGRIFLQAPPRPGRESSSLPSPAARCSAANKYFAHNSLEVASNQMCSHLVRQEIYLVVHL